MIRLPLLNASRKILTDHIEHILTYPQIVDS